MGLLRKICNYFSRDKIHNGELIYCNDYILMQDIYSGEKRYIYGEMKVYNLKNRTIHNIVQSISNGDALLHYNIDDDKFMYYLEFDNTAKEPGKYYPGDFLCRVDHIYEGDNSYSGYALIHKEDLISNFHFDVGTPSLDIKCLDINGNNQTIPKYTSIKYCKLTQYIIFIKYQKQCK